jgi:hypothetical protein
MNIYHQYDPPPDTRKDIVSRIPHDTIPPGYRCDWCQIRRWFAKDNSSKMLLCGWCFEKLLRWQRTE